MSNEASKPKSPSPEGRGGAGPAASLLVGHSPTMGDAPSSRLASGPAALPPKSEVIFERTLSLAITSLTQAVSALLGLRGFNLKWGLEKLFGTLAPGLEAKAKVLAHQILLHPLLSDSSMDRVSQRFTANMRVITIAGAAIVSLALVVDSIVLWKQIARSPELRNRVIGMA